MEVPVSADAIASIYTIILNDSEFRDLVADDPAVLDKFTDLTDEEKGLLIDVAASDVEGFGMTSNPVVGYIGNNLPLSQPIGSSLGVAMAHSAGLPTSSLFNNAAGCECCKWKGGFARGAWVINPGP